MVRQLDEMRSPCLDLSGSFVFINIRHSIYPQVGPALFSERRRIVSDSTLSRLLYYPVALDSVAVDQAIEVAYVQKDSRMVMMTYVANRKDVERVQQHFGVFRDRVGIDLDIAFCDLSSRSECALSSDK
jgi:hypothetical protein